VGGNEREGGRDIKTGAQARRRYRQEDRRHPPPPPSAALFTPPPFPPPHSSARAAERSLSFGRRPAGRRRTCRTPSRSVGGTTPRYLSMRPFQRAGRPPTATRPANRSRSSSKRRITCIGYVTCPGASHDTGCRHFLIFFKLRAFLRIPQTASISSAASNCKQVVISSSSVSLEVLQGHAHRVRDLTRAGRRDGHRARVGGRRGVKGASGT
jgi:hypothetical protein